jgi:predicted alpha-1,6-mannanase (GH76 family)
MLRTKSPRVLFKTLLPALLFCLASVSTSTVQAAPEVSGARADTALKAWNAAYWNPTGKYFYKGEGKTGNRIDFWITAHVWETVMEAFVRTKDSTYLTQVNDLYDGFIAQEDTIWTDNFYNDDIAWWIIAATRAYEITGRQRYLNVAKWHMDWLFATQVDTVMGGGMWWLNTSHDTKNTCVNGPAIIAALNLARILNDTTYRAKARSLYVWQKARLVEPGGKVYDNINKNGNINQTTYSYNVGVHLASAMGFGEVGHADTVAQWLRDNQTNNDILRGTGTNQGDGATFDQIFVRYVLQLAKLPGKSRFREWMKINAEVAWDNRRRSNNLMGHRWSDPAPNSNIQVQAAGGGVMLLNLLAMSDTNPVVALQPRTAYEKPRVPRASLTKAQQGAPQVLFDRKAWGLDGKMQGRLEEMSGEQGP